jgi:uncharacterized damage-inducible protein DinB
MTLTNLFLEQLDKEAARTKATLANVPTGKDDFKPADKSMPLGRLAMLVAQMPSWIPLILDQDALDLGAGNVDQTPLRTPAELLAALDKGVASAKKSLRAADDARLMTTWKLQMKGQTVSEDQRYAVIRDTFSHLAHHRAQLGVYLRMNGAKVAAVYGPSADDQHFA